MVCHEPDFYEGWMDQIWDFNELTSKDKRDPHGFSFQILLRNFPWGGTDASELLRSSMIIQLSLRSPIIPSESGTEIGNLLEFDFVVTSTLR